MKLKSLPPFLFIWGSLWRQRFIEPVFCSKGITVISHPHYQGFPFFALFILYIYKPFVLLDFPVVAANTRVFLSLTHFLSLSSSSSLTLTVHVGIFSLSFLINFNLSLSLSLIQFQFNSIYLQSKPSLIHSISKSKNTDYYYTILQFQILEIVRRYGRSVITAFPIRDF